MNSDICTVDMENSPQCHRCMSQGGMQTLQQTLSSSACAVALAPGAEDDYDDDENNDDVDDDDYVDNDDDCVANADEDLQHLSNVAQQPHHVAQQVGFLREPLFALKKKLVVQYECKMYRSLWAHWVEALNVKESIQCRWFHDFL